MGKTKCFSMCRKRKPQECKTRFCNYIQGDERQFCRLTPRYKMDPDNNCAVKKNYTQKNSGIFINEFVNGHLRRKKVNKMRRKVATRKISTFLDGKVRKKVATRKIHKFLDGKIRHFLKSKINKNDEEIFNIINDKPIEKYNAEEVIKKLKSSVDKEEQQEIYEMVPADQVTELVEREHMFNPEIQFYFYSASKDVAPGKGARETIPAELSAEYKQSLAEFPDFRKMLSNFGECRFQLDGMEWYSVEHYYQGSKFKKNNPEFYRLFSLDSGSEMSKDPNMSKAYGGKSGKYKGKQVRAKGIVVDEDFFGSSGRGTQEMFDSQLAKFSQDDRMRRMLLATKDAQLNHTLPRSSLSIRFDNLVYFRELMKEGKL
jgi:predicted NAD-dependent protein-ADP-ribosyltransferase YbiA (DUF1768 family)